MHLYVGATGNDLCPIAAVVTYLALTGMEAGPLFRLQSRQPITQAHFVDKVRSAMKAAGMDPSGYSGHCFRIGASTTAAANVWVMQPSRFFAGGQVTATKGTYECHEMS